MSETLENKQERKKPENGNKQQSYLIVPCKRRVGKKKGRYTCLSILLIFREEKKRKAIILVSTLFYGSHRVSDPFGGGDCLSVTLLITPSNTNNTA